MPLAEQAQKIAAELPFGRGNLLVALTEACKIEVFPSTATNSNPTKCLMISRCCWRLWMIVGK